MAQRPIVVASSDNLRVVAVESDDDHYPFQIEERTTDGMGNDAWTEVAENADFNDTVALLVEEILALRGEA